jgi:hypothetical protein
MTDTLQRLADISVLAFVVLSMLAMGMSQRLAAVVSPLRDSGRSLRRWQSTSGSLRCWRCC